MDPGAESGGEGLAGGGDQSRRLFVKQMAGTAAAASLLPNMFGGKRVDLTPSPGPSGPDLEAELMVDIHLRINGKDVSYRCDPRVTLLDLLRERLDSTGTKKGCDHGQCGACTVLVDGRRINSCLSLAVTNDGSEVTTVEGLAQNGRLHPVQAAFLEHDGFQCGYCTPGQICSAVALIKEGHTHSDAEIREWMSGNLCRCGAYTNIVAAIRDAAGKRGTPA